MPEAPDPKAIVARGYDQIVDRYFERFGQSTVRARKFQEFVAGLPDRARVLDLGCGAGAPAADLTRRGFAVTGVDGSAAQIERAKRIAPNARFIHGDITAIDFDTNSFDAVCAFYSITHVPRDEHPLLFGRIARWLKPGGRFIASFGTEKGDVIEDWLGVSMFFSHEDPEATLRLLAGVGLQVERAEVLEQDNEPVAFLWVTCGKR
ncbi:MAG TPA: class I SAM-dependent methyltransferase [Roseiarcus sp.]|nr:class I SAM-dependent methyltransferase [Roseiarcus sp.]